MDFKNKIRNNQYKIIFSILILILSGMICLSCASDKPAVLGIAPKLIAPVSPVKPIVIRIALAYISQQGVKDKFDLESAEIVKRTWEAYYIEVKQYPRPGKKQKTSIVKVYTADGFPEWERW